MDWRQCFRQMKFTYQLRWVFWKCLKVLQFSLRTLNLIWLLLLWIILFIYFNTWIIFHFSFFNYLFFIWRLKRQFVNNTKLWLYFRLLGKRFFVGKFLGRLKNSRIFEPGIVAKIRIERLLIVWSRLGLFDETFGLVLLITWGFIIIYRWLVVFDLWLCLFNIKILYLKSRNCLFDNIINLILWLLCLYQIFLYLMLLRFNKDLRRVW